SESGRALRYQPLSTVLSPKPMNWLNGWAAARSALGANANASAASTPIRNRKSKTSAGEKLPRLLVHAHPAVRHQPLLRQEAALVVHLARAAHPIAEIDVRQAHARGARDVVEDHEGAKRTVRFLRIEERIDH